MSGLENFCHWKGTQDEKGIVWLTLDRQDTAVNTLNTAVMQEFNAVLDRLKEIRPKGLVIRSGKSTGFIAGADISQFTSFSSATEATALIREGQKIFDRLEALPFPTVALIQGFCLGGGMELALACRYRIAIDSPKTKLGLPEILLGIQPGWGGTVRLPRLIGILKAMDLILSGRLIAARQAKKLGMVDEAVPERHALFAVEHYLTTQPESRKAAFYNKIFNFDFIRPLLGRFLSKNVSKKVKAKHYPAPFAVIENWVEAGIEKDESMLLEAESIGKLLVSPTAKNLVRVFFLREGLKKLAKKTNYKPRHVHVVGAGVMGGDIAAYCALRGFHVTLQDTNLQAIAATFKRAGQLFSKTLKSSYEVQAAQDRLSPDLEGLGVSVADVIIEAIVENVEAKQQLFQNLERMAKPEALLATNTSTIPLKSISEGMKNPKRLLGIHFFNPVAKMPLVEVVQDEHTDPRLFDQAMAFVGQIDKLPLPVKSAPGFLVNRVLLPYLTESITLLEEGMTPHMIDHVAKEFGMPMGPVELADTVGLDVCMAAAKSMGIQLPKQVEQMVRSGRLGKKTDQGFYSYKNGQMIKSKRDSNLHAPKDTADRLMMRMINEAVACLREGIVAEVEGLSAHDLLDAGMIFGTGFAPFRGGPMQYIHDQQKHSVVNRLNELAKRYGNRFMADEGWAV